MIPKCIPLKSAARQLGVPIRTLKRWLQVECGLVFQRIPKGGTHLVYEKDVERVLARRLPDIKFGVAERKTA